MKKIIKFSALVLLLLTGIFHSSEGKAMTSTVRFEKLVYIEGDIFIIEARSYEEVEWVNNDEEVAEIIKIYGKNNKFAKVRAKKKGTCLITGGGSKAAPDHYFICIEPKPKRLSYKYKDTGFIVSDVNQDYLILKMELYNGSKKNLRLDLYYTLQKKVNGKWKTLGREKAAIECGVALPKKSRLKYSLPLLNMYDYLDKGKYRLGLVMNGKKIYDFFEVE